MAAAPETDTVRSDRTELTTARPAPRPSRAARPGRRATGRRLSAQRRGAAVVLGLVSALALATGVHAAPAPTGAVVPSADGGHPPAASGDGGGTASGDGAVGAAAVSPSAVDAGRSPAGSGYVWPTGDPAAVVRAFDGPPSPWARGHRGVDLELAVGAPVLAAADGVVAFAGTVVDRPVISIDHADGVRTTYEPVRPAVREGQRVTAGETIGHLEPGHCLVLQLTTCLHLGARTGPRAYVDPLRLLGADVVVRLLPENMDLAG
ncbi:peptidase M23-like protein [Georgenia soli]|uniref:Peptidase M23-like protein n=1 Tax=Georgenia soli TaxID=638953 RepID=A0A2A9EJQ8_9MICO|nr:M23 family metallopeptidase [Georgenia soli]PFG38492.1 peptidase M23-like protein [Georgenia soli]